MTAEVSVAVVGLGSRGLGVLERIVTLAKRAGPAAGPVRVEIIDPTGTGAGVHDVTQPDYLLLNTTCAQVSLFPDACTVGDATDAPGPTLWDWVTARGLRLAEDGFTVGAHGRPIRPEDFLPRRILGGYLSWFREELLRRVPPHVTVTRHLASAVDLRSGADGTVTVELSDGTAVEVRHVFLTTGYTGDDGPAADRVVPEPYPLPARLADVAPGDSVGIGGFGLSAFDLVSCLTVGRGGRYVGDDELRYVPSGQEPTIFLYSRSGVPCRARPRVVEFGPPHVPAAFTEAAIDAVRARRTGPLDFDRDILPLIHTEMRVGYRRCEARLAGVELPAVLRNGASGTPGSGSRHPAARARGSRDGTPASRAGDPGDGAGPAELLAALDDLDARLGPFDPRALLDGAEGMLLDDAVAYQKWLAETVRRDLAEGVLGFARSPIKAALDVLRIGRDTFRYVVDFGGLTLGSLDTFTRHTVPAVNRAVVGPQYERHTELLALMAAGVAHVPFGPAPTVTRSGSDGGGWTIASTRLAVPHVREVDWLLSAHVRPPGVESSTSPLLRALREKGWIRRYRPASREVRGIDLDADMHPVDVSGRVDRRLWFLGPLCEGVTFYNNLVPSPNMWSRPVADAHRCVVEMYTASGRPTV
ncbi:FAD/NAD(P)-binding protein [Longispora sp. NPDC051575]|uniref:FAD/NAD(P)-binding protein n=1 Tax=Longispora sp. NPDC051575 TaxID=3154943 RepID=UPI0034147359